MASARQRSRKHAQRVHHQHTQRARLRAALDAALPGTMAEVRERMHERGYYPDLKGRWKREQTARADALVHPRRGPSWAGIVAKRKRKRR